MDQLIPLIVALPIAGFVFSALFGRRIQANYGKAAASFVPVGLIVITWLIAMAVVVTELTGGFGPDGASVTLWDWIQVGPAGQAGSFGVDIGFRVDELTAVLLIVVTTIGMLVHIYSIGYMSHDGGYWRFFAYLNLFMFSMLLLVLADNFLRRLRRLGARRAVELLAHRILVPPAGRGDRGQEGVHRQSRRRRGLRPGDHRDLDEHRDAEHPTICSRSWPS